MAVVVPFSQRAEEESKQLLALMAQYGNVGKQLFEQTRQQAAQDRTAAVDTALRQAMAINAPGALQQQLSQTVARPTEQQTVDIGAAERLFGLGQASRTAANRQYFEQLKASIPIVEARAAARRAELEQAAKDRALELELRRQQLELAKEQAGPEAELRKQELELKRQQLELARQELAATGGKLSPQAKRSAAQKFVIDKVRANASPGTQKAFFTLISMGEGPEILGLLNSSNARWKGNTLELLDAEGKVRDRFTGVSRRALEDWVLRYYNPELEYKRAFRGGQPVTVQPAKPKPKPKQTQTAQAKPKSKSLVERYLEKVPTIFA